MVNSQALLGKCSQACTLAQSSAHSSTQRWAVLRHLLASSARMGRIGNPIPTHSNNKKSAIKKTIEKNWNSPCPPPLWGHSCLKEGMWAKNRDDYVETISSYFPNPTTTILPKKNIRTLHFMECRLCK